MTFAEFRKTRRWSKTVGEDNELGQFVEGFVYLDGRLFLWEDEDTKDFWLMLGSFELGTDTTPLRKLEEDLYAWAKDEGYFDDN